MSKACNACGPMQVSLYVCLWSNTGLRVVLRLLIPARARVLTVCRGQVLSTPRNQCTPRCCVFSTRSSAMSAAPALSTPVQMLQVLKLSARDN